jgi:hypothetical protein
MKTIKILKVLINILYILLLVIFGLGVLLLTAVLFFNDYLPWFLQGYKMLFTSFDWKLLLTPFSTVVNFILFTLSVYYLRQCIKPFIASDFYSEIVINNLKKVGRLYVFIGVSTIFFRLIAILYFQSRIPQVQGYSGLKAVGALTSSIDITITFLIIIGLFFLLFSSTFEKAKEFKQDSDLTI